MHRSGRHAALETYGLKHAGIMDTARAGASMARTAFFGAPGTAAAIKAQHAAGTLTAPGGAYHKPLSWLTPKLDFGYKGQDTWARTKQIAGSLAAATQPLTMAYSGYEALSAPPEHRGEALGNLLGNLGGSTAGAPFGMAGQMVGGTLGSMAGRSVGKAIGGVVAPKQDVPPEYFQQPSE